jgi:hypothetical protein
MVLPRKTKTYATYRWPPVICTGFPSPLDGTANGMLTFNKRERRRKCEANIDGWTNRRMVKGNEGERSGEKGTRRINDSNKGWRDDHTKK